MGRNEKPATETALAVIGADLTPATVYGTEEGKGLHAILDKIIAEVRGTVIDVSTKAGREAANSLAFKVARSKTLLDDMGKDLVADWKAKSAKVDAERKIIRDRLDTLKAEVKQPVEEWEAAEADRIAGHLNAITAIEDIGRLPPDVTSVEIAQQQDKLRDVITSGRDWQEFADQAAAMATATGQKLKAELEATLKREADARELAALRAEKAERDQRDAEQAAAQQAENNRIQAEAAETERQRQADIDKRLTAEAAVEAERKRVADQQAADQAAAEKRERNKRHRAKIIREASEAIFEVCLAHADSPRDRLVEAIVAAIAGDAVPHVTIDF